MFKNVKRLSTKLLMAFIIVTLISSISGIVGTILLWNTDSGYSKALQENGFSQGEIGTFNTYLNKGGAIVRDIITLTNAADVKASQAELDDAAVKTNAALEALRPNCQTPDELALIATIDAKLPDYRVLRDKAINLGLQNKNDEAMSVFRTEARPVLNEVMAAAQQLADINVTMGTNVSNSLSAQTQTTMFIMIAIIVVGLTISVILAIAVAKSLSRPIEAVRDAAKKLSNGELDIDVQTDLKDEIGVMAKSFTDAGGMIRAYISDIGRGLGALADGDFNVQPTEEFKGDFKQIEVSIVQIIDSLSDTLGQINQASDQVSSGSDQVSSGAQALSQGATEQASSVEELSATITEISEKVKANASDALDASRQVGGLRNELEASNQQMQEMIGAMTEISNSSNQIGKIIKTIEDIAFQTNILALNAAVEAARAGAAGKGFAVVAEEVRSLAGKSQEAAKNTTSLIQGSIEAVGRGTKLADGTAKSLLQVVDGAKNVTVTVDKISAASSEQAGAIAQVTQGIEQISSVVQTNSATAEESAAASEELSGQASMLKSLVSKFRLKSAAPTASVASVSERASRPAAANASYSSSSKY